MKILPLLNEYDKVIKGMPVTVDLLDSYIKYVNSTKYKVDIDNEGVFILALANIYDNKSKVCMFHANLDDHDEIKVYKFTIEVGGKLLDSTGKTSMPRIEKQIQDIFDDYNSDKTVFVMPTELGDLTQLIRNNTNYSNVPNFYIELYNEYIRKYKLF